MLIAAAHGTTAAAGLATVRAITDAVRRSRPSLTVVQAYLDVAEPSLAEVVAGTSGPAVVVPVLLSGGYHVHSDIPAILNGRPELTATAALGPDPAIALALADRLATARAGSPIADLVVLVSAGSSDPSARADVETAAGHLAELLDRPVEVAVLAGPGRSLAEVASGRRTGALEIATYLLAEGRFDTALRSQAGELGISAVGAPIGAHPAIVNLVLARYDAAAASRGL